MRVTFYRQWDGEHFWETGEFRDIGHVYVDHYDGPVELAKKGREGEEQIAQQQKDLAAHNQQVQDAARNTSEPFAKSLLATKPGEMSPYAKDRYASDVRAINDAYGNARRVGLRALTLRGLNQAPTGAESSIMNTADNGAAVAETGARSDAMDRTLSGGLDALKYYQGQQSQYNALPALDSAGLSNYRRSSMGSTLGDVMGGIGTLAGAAGSVMTGMGGMGARF